MLGMPQDSHSAPTNPDHALGAVAAGPLADTQVSGSECTAVLAGLEHALPEEGSPHRQKRQSANDELHGLNAAQFQGVRRSARYARGCLLNRLRQPGTVKVGNEWKADIRGPDFCQAN